MNLFLAPHHDDEALFGAYTLLRHRPLVVVCFDGDPRHGARDIRQAETAAAMDVLGCRWEKLPQGGSLKRELAVYGQPERVWAPLAELDGNPDHNEVALAAVSLWGERVSFYTTYTTEGRTRIGEPVPTEPGWEDLKRAALACYRSQIAQPWIRPHFERGLDEYVVLGVANLLDACVGNARSVGYCALSLAVRDGSADSLAPLLFGSGTPRGCAAHGG